MRDITVNRFRQKRGKLLREQIAKLSRSLGRDIVILDVGGRPDYWNNVSTENISKIVLMNYDQGELEREGADGDLFEHRVGDARDLSQYADGEVDLVHSNSVIEHVGSWNDMNAMARELRRVGQGGWVQTPAWSFPIEPHFRLPFIHWFAAPLRACLLRLSPDYRAQTLSARREHVERINLLSRSEMATAFPGTRIWTERVLFAKSYVAIW